VEPNNQFSINPITGVISSTVPLDFETTSSYTFFVTTIEGVSQANSNPNLRAEVRINVLVGSPPFSYVCLKDEHSSIKNENDS